MKLRGSLGGLHGERDRLQSSEVDVEAADHRFKDFGSLGCKPRRRFHNKRMHRLKLRVDGLELRHEVARQCRIRALHGTSYERPQIALR